jgi:hypothetical protein
MSKNSPPCTSRRSSAPRHREPRVISHPFQPHHQRPTPKQNHNKNAAPRPHGLNCNWQINRLLNPLLTALFPPHNRRRHPRAQSPAPQATKTSSRTSNPQPPTYYYRFPTIRNMIGVRARRLIGRFWAGGCLGIARRGRGIVGC